MPNEIRQEGLFNTAIQNVENANVHVTQVLGKSLEYSELQHQLSNLQKLFDLTPACDTDERLRISGELNALKVTVEEFKKDVRQIVQLINDSEVDTERLKRAKDFLDKGQLKEAQAVFEIDLNQMLDEQAYWLSQRDHAEENLRKSSDEFFFLALTKQTDYSDSTRFEKVCDYFNKSLQSNANKSNIFQFGFFLQQQGHLKEAQEIYTMYLNGFSEDLTGEEKALALNNFALLYKYEGKFDGALKMFDEALKIRRDLAQTLLPIHRSSVADTLNNLGVLHCAINDYPRALKEYGEALEIYRDLANESPRDHLPAVAGTLNNLALLHKAQNRYEESLREFEESLKISRELAQAEPALFMSFVGMALLNLATLHLDGNKGQLALAESEEALAIYSELAGINPHTYLPYLATVLNNIAISHRLERKYEEALQKYQEALEIKRALIKTNREAYLPTLAESLNNIANLNADLQRFEKAVEEFLETLNIYRVLAKENPDAYLPHVARTLNNFATLEQDMGIPEEALKKHEEALEIRSRLAELNPSVFKISVAETNFNLAILYVESIPDREKSIKYTIEAIVIILSLTEAGAYIKQYLDSATKILHDWGMNDQEISEAIDKRETNSR